MARDGTKSGGRAFQKGNTFGTGGLRKGTVVKHNDFKDWALEMWERNKKEFEAAVMDDRKNMMDFLKLVASFVPKEVDLGNKNGEPLIVKWQQ